MSVACALGRWALSRPKNIVVAAPPSVGLNLQLSKCFRLVNVSYSYPRQSEEESPLLELAVL